MPAWYVVVAAFWSCGPQDAPPFAAALARHLALPARAIPAATRPSLRAVMRPLFIAF